MPLTGPYQGRNVFVDGPEYETIAGCGSNLGIFDPYTILEIYFYCDAYGLDTISVGTSIAFVMECFEMGLIKSSHTGGLALKGPQHDEAWLIFLDMVHNFMPAFEHKAEALHWFPMFRTWFGLCGLCKLPWNDIVPTDNKDTAEPAKVEKHVCWYSQYFNAVTGRETTPEGLIAMSEAVYNFQRVFNLKMGFGTRRHDAIPYRAMGPVTAEEYQSRQERYDKQLVEKYDVDIAGKSTREKVALLRKLREAQYEQLKDAVYRRRGWTPAGIPTVAKVKRLGIDFPEVLEVLKANGVAQ